MSGWFKLSLLCIRSLNTASVFAFSPTTHFKINGLLTREMATLAKAFEIMRTFYHSTTPGCRHTLWTPSSARPSQGDTKQGSVYLRPADSARAPLATQRRSLEGSGSPGPLFFHAGDTASPWKQFGLGGWAGVRFKTSSRSPSQQLRGFSFAYIYYVRKKNPVTYHQPKILIKDTFFRCKVRNVFRLFECITWAWLDEHKADVLREENSPTFLSLKNGMLF